MANTGSKPAPAVASSAVPLLASYGVNNPMPATPPQESLRLNGRDIPLLPLPTTFPRVANLSASRRNAAIEEALCGGALATHLLEWVPVALRWGDLRATAFVSPDWIGFGDARLLFRVPLPARALQRVAARYGATLATARVVDAIHAQAPVSVPFLGLRPTAQALRLTMDALPVWQIANAHIEAIRGGRRALVSDGMKDVVIGAMQARNRSKVCIYGGWTDAGRVQPISTVHTITYVDYSQCGRLLRDTMSVDGRGEMRVADVLADARLCRLLLAESEGGPVRDAGYR